MAIYLVGDIQGCYQELCQLMAKVSFDKATDQLWFTGDLVARGPNSLDTLRMVKSLGNAAKVVLGNHDLHLLAVHAGIKPAKSNDKLDSLLHAPDIDELTDWLAQQPLLLQLPNEQAFVSHAGFSPQWSISDAIEQSELIQQKISSKQRNKWLALMYGSMPNSWTLAKSEEEIFRYSINALTRMRYCFSDGSLEFKQKDAPHHNTDSQLHPWFSLQPELDTTLWVFGHWASLEGQCEHPNVYALDTGCIWGGTLTMLRWDDKQLFSVEAVK